MGKKPKELRKAAEAIRERLLRHGVSFPEDLAAKFGPGGAEIYAKAAHSALERLEKGLTPADQRGALARYFRQLDADLAQAERGQNLACRAGCHFCCHQAVSTIPIEMDRVLELIDTWDEAPRTELQARLKDRQRTLCPLNSDGLCQVYEVRPSPCRGFHSRQVAPCRSIPTGKTEPIPVVPLRQAYAICHVMGFRDAVGQMGLSTEPLDLVESLRKHLL